MSYYFLFILSFSFSQLFLNGVKNQNYLIKGRKGNERIAKKERQLTCKHHLQNSALLHDLILLSQQPFWVANTFLLQMRKLRSERLRNSSKLTLLEGDRWRFECSSFWLPMELWFYSYLKNFGRLLPDYLSIYPYVSFIHISFVSNNKGVK